MMKPIDSLSSLDISVYGVIAVCFLFAISSFIWGNDIKADMLGKFKEAALQNEEPKYTPKNGLMALYGYTFPLCLVLLLYVGNAEVESKYQYAAWAMIPLATVVDKVMPEFFHSSAAFGIRGIMIGGLAIASGFKLLQEAGNEMEFLSLIAFGMGAWMACGMGAILIWTSRSDLDFGNYEKLSRHMASIVQFYLLLGFVFKFAALIMQHDDDDQPATVVEEAANAIKEVVNNDTHHHHHHHITVEEIIENLTDE